MHRDGIRREEIWIQVAIENYQTARGEFPYSLSIAIAGRPNAAAAFERIGVENMTYQLHPVRGYLLTFIRRMPHAGDGHSVDVRVEDHSSFLWNLRQLQNGVSAEP